MYKNNAIWKLAPEKFRGASEIERAVSEFRRRDGRDHLWRLVQYLTKRGSSEPIPRPTLVEDRNFEITFRVEYKELSKPDLLLSLV